MSDKRLCAECMQLAECCHEMAGAFDDTIEVLQNRGASTPASVAAAKKKTDAALAEFQAAKEAVA